MQGHKWNRRWFALENGVLTYAKNKQAVSIGDINVFAIHEMQYVKPIPHKLEFEVRSRTNLFLYPTPPIERNELTYTPSPSILAVEVPRARPAFAGSVPGTPGLMAECHRESRPWC